MRSHRMALAVVGSGCCRGSSLGLRSVRGRGLRCLRLGGSAQDADRIDALPAPGGLGDGALVVVQACAQLLLVQRPVVDDEVQDLLVAQARIHAQASERQVVAALALIVQIMPLAKPCVAEAQVGFDPALQHFLGGCGRSGR